VETQREWGAEEPTSTLEPPGTVPGRFLLTVRRDAERVALRQRNGEAWESLTYAQLGDAVAGVAAGLAALGVGRGDRIVLMLRNGIAFHVVDMAAYFCGATPVSIYNSSSPDQVAYLAGNSDATIAVVDDAAFGALFAQVRTKLPSLRTIVSVRDDSGDTTYADLLAHPPIDLETAAAAGRPDDLATVIYTSGTTGPPKGVMLTHRSICCAVDALAAACGRELDWFRGKRTISYLPMAHIAERLSTQYCGTARGYEITVCPEMDQLGSYLREVHPNIFFGVPRVFEKLHAGVNAVMSADSVKAERFAGAIQTAVPMRRAVAWGLDTQKDRDTLRMLDDSVFAGVRAVLGLDQIDLAVVGAAPMTPALLDWYQALGVTLSELYGMSESSGPMTWAPYGTKTGTVGPALPGTEIRLLDDGEIVCRGAHVFSGYLGDPERTAEALDADGWLHSGDVGTIDDDGYVTIIDRKKELLITAGGKNVSPANLEAALKTVPLVGQAFAVGDRMPHTAALLVLDPDKIRVWSASAGRPEATPAELARYPSVHDLIAAGIEVAMAEFSHAERIKRWVVLPDEWLPDTDELTPTAKLQRRAITAKYAAEIASLYV
jgi:long-chain acyl-CoA synthetase